MSITGNITKPYPELSLVELAAHAVIEANNRLDKRKTPLSDEAKKRLHGVWINIKTALSDTTIPQIMYIIEKNIIIQLAPQHPESTIDLASKIEILWEQLVKQLGNTSLPIGINSCRSIHKQWENEALRYLWNTISEQINQPPNLAAINDIEAWFEDPANSEILKSIKEINFSDRTIQAIPPQLLKCPQLQKFVLVESKITTLPEWFGNLRQLKYLSLIKSKITTLPESLSNLSQLKYLYLSGVQITTLPVSFGNLGQLQYLDLLNTKITTFPESFGNLNQLKCLYLPKNQITTFPESFGSLSQLQIVESVSLS